MSKIDGTVRNFKEELDAPKSGDVMWTFEVECAVGAGFERRDVQMCSPRFMGAIWNQMHVEIADSEARPIVVDSVAVKDDVGATVSAGFEEKWRESPDDSFEGEVLRFLARREVIHEILTPEGSPPKWFPVWDLELQAGARHVLVEFRSEQPWYGSISEGDRILARGRRSSGNVLLATRLDNKSNGSVFEYQRSGNRYW